MLMNILAKTVFQGDRCPDHLPDHLDTTRKFVSGSSVANDLRSNSAISGKIRSRSESRAQFQSTNKKSWQ